MKQLIEGMDKDKIDWLNGVIKAVLIEPQFGEWHNGIISFEGISLWTDNFHFVV